VCVPGLLSLRARKSEIAGEPVILNRRRYEIVGKHYRAANLDEF